MYLLQLVQALKFECTFDKTLDPNGSSLAQFLIDRATSDPILGTFFYWYVIVECEDLVCGKLYAKVAFHYIEALIRVSSTCALYYVSFISTSYHQSPEGYKRRIDMREQGKLMSKLTNLARDIRNMKEPRLKKVCTQLSKCCAYTHQKITCISRLTICERKLQIPRERFTNSKQLRCHWSLPNK